ncbi:hypothetical protein EGH22_08305 [Halomicroarcula sp. F28]|uniref:Transcription regulator TrmB C-terminal domain-containing protein n=1 Tax=Haloarcula salinisoli TaxID=2487746 RepID=A0A8J8C6F4_9EURY|nr:TrmB family transcriptional regulator sugar-binding domain-containing protein [Halomicroarcula salinisoli]MBX0286325.1 hypothetical protein [Halomicroarcula salinisoli]MBX0302187.1 hypothetical protein [Halomicroarcula salinisoli]
MEFHDPCIEAIDGSASIRTRLRALLAEARREVLLSIPVEAVPVVRDRLGTAIENDVAVLLLLYGDGEVPDDLDELATVVRRLPGQVPLTCLVDQWLTLLGWPWVLSDSSDDTLATFVDSSHITLGLFGEFVGNYWSMGREIHVADPPTLPRHYPTFRGGVLGATLHLRQGSKIQTTCKIAASGETALPETEITGLALDVRQGLVYPMTNRFPSENGMVLRVDGERVTVGGVGAYVEDYAAESVTLEHA